MSRPESRWWQPVPRRVFLLLLALYLPLRLGLALLPGYANDVEQYKRWALHIARNGAPKTYEASDVDYPPVFPLVLGGAGELYLLVHPVPPADAVSADPLLTFLVKSPHLIADLLLGALLWFLVGRLGYWGAACRDPGWGRLAALLYLWNPMVLWGSAYWGQPDGAHSLLALAALAALASHRFAASGALLAAAGLTKPLAAPLVPLYAVATALRGRLRGLMLVGLGGLAVGLLAFLPFLFGGRLLHVLRRVLIDVEAMPFTSVNGHNLWWILGGWRPANAPLLAGVTAKEIGLTLFLAAYAALLARAWSWMRRRESAPTEYGSRLVLTAAALSCAFFALSTHMHENHLFMAVPFLLAVAGRDGRLLLLAALASLAAFLNMTLHDPLLPQALPGVLAAPSGVIDPHLGHPYTWLQLLGSFANAVLVLGVSAAAYVAAWRSYGNSPAE